MISKYSVKRPYTVVVGVVLILLLGYVSFTSMKTDLLPDMTLPYAIVYTSYAGASPEEVEQTLTRPIEQAMATISNIENINSVSSENISMVILEFSQSANMDAVTIEMRESLDQIKGYWSDSVGSPMIMKMNPDMLPVMVAAMDAGELSQSELTELVNNQILPELESIEGVASVSASGTIDEKVQVMLREDKLEALNRQIVDALDQKFEDARAELQDAQDALDEGKTQLEEGQNQLASQTSRAEGQLNSGTSQMIAGQVQIDQKLAEVEAGLQKMDASEAELQEQEKQLTEGEAALQQLPAQMASLQAQQEQLATAITQLESAPEQLTKLNAAIAGADAQIAALTSQLEALTGEGSGDSQTGSEETGTENSGAGENADGETSVQPQANLQDAPMTKTQSGEDDMILEEEPLAAPEAPQTSESGSTITILSQSEIDDLTADAETAAQIAQLQAQILAKQTEKQQYVAAKVQALAALSVLGVNTTGSDSEIVNSMDTVKSGLVTRKLQLEDGMAQLQQNIDAMPQQLETIEQGKEAVAAGKLQLASGRRQLEEAKAQLTTAKSQIASGQTTVSQAVAQLNQAEISATIEMGAAKAELNAGQKELDAALEQIDNQKDTAYEQADVTQIVTAEMVKGILAAQNFSMPAGYVSEDGTDYLVRVGNKLTDTEQLENLVLMDLHIDGVDPIRVSDVADVSVEDNSDSIYARVNGKPGVMFTMQKQSGYSTGDVSQKIKKKFAQLEADHEDAHFIELMDQGVYIDLVVNSVIQNMLSGAVLAILVLLLFLKSFRPTLVIACSIPISIMAAIVMMYFSNISLNIISLSGLALGIGMLVDNSIVVIENIYRLRGEGYSAKQAAVEGARQVAGAIAASTLTTICVFAPIIFTEGITRQLFVDMGLTIAYSLIASLVAALTLVPMMGAGLLKNVSEKRSPLFERLQKLYAGILKICLKMKLLVILGAVALLIWSGYLAISKGTAFMPEMESTQVSVTVQAPKGSTLKETAAVSDEVIARILTIQDVADVGAMNGTGSSLGMLTGSAGSNTEQVSMYVLLNEDKTITNEELVREIKNKTDDLDCEVNVETSTMDMSALGGTGISVEIRGRDLDRLKAMAEDVAARVETVEGTKNVSDGIEEKTLEFRLVVEKEKAMAYQLTTAQIYQVLQQKLADAQSATTLSTVSNDYDVMVVSDTDETLTREKIEALTVTGKDEENKDVEVPLGKLVKFEDTEGFSSINRKAQTRYVTVSAEVDDDHNIGLVASEVQDALDDYEVPEGYSIEMAGEDETINEAMVQVFKMLALAVVFMYLIMVAQFQSLLSPFIIMFTIPLAFTGGLFGLYLTDNPVSVIAMIGFVMLSGIIVNNGIVLVDYINQLRRDGMEKREAIVEAGRTRLRPIIMTALTTILGLLTMAFGMGMGADMVQPMAIVTIGGLLYGTLLTLVVVPCIYDILNRKKNRKEEEF